MNNALQYAKLFYVFMACATTLLLTFTIWTFKNDIENHGTIERLPDPFGRISNYNIWLIFTRVTPNSPLRIKFSSIVRNLLNVTSVDLHFHVVVDASSYKLAVDVLEYASKDSKHRVSSTLYNMSDVAQTIEDVVDVMKPHFSSNPGTYYSDALFYISIGLYRLAPADQKYAVLLDCDLYFKEDITLLFNEFLSFKPTALFGLAPELSPVYRHILHKYRISHETTFGDFYHASKYSIPQVHPLGFQGYNSGVVLLNFERIRDSKLYSSLLTNSSINYLTEKYMFRGHLGDQDFYTLVGYEYPQLIQTLNCGFNKQLCTWWRDHGYGDIFSNYSKCEHKVIIVHGNCNTQIVVR